MTDYIREYWELIRSGQETVGQKVRAVYSEIIRELDAPGDYYYDEKRAELESQPAKNEKYILA